jgi:hypothetical protein
MTLDWDKFVHDWNTLLPYNCQISISMIWNGETPTVYCSIDGARGSGRTLPEAFEQAHLKWVGAQEMGVQP